MIQTEPITKTDILNALNNLAFITLENEYKEKCTMCNQLISLEDEKLPLDEGVCYNCKFGPTGDPEDTEER